MFLSMCTLLWEYSKRFPVSHLILLFTEIITNRNIMDIAKRCEQNPLLAPKDLKAGINGMEITCLLNPGVFKYQGKIWLLLRVAERPIQKEGIISFPIYNEKGKIEVVSPMQAVGRFCQPYIIAAKFGTAWAMKSEILVTYLLFEQCTIFIMRWEYHSMPCIVFPIIGVNQSNPYSYHDVLLTIGFKYRRYSLQRWTGISTYFRKRRAGSIRHWGLPCCNNRRWFLPYFHRSIVGTWNQS